MDKSMEVQAMVRKSTARQMTLLIIWDKLLMTFDELIK